MPRASIADRADQAGGVPEGHTIHRQVVDQAPLLVGRAISVSSPGGRWAHVAAAVDGRVLRTLEAHGKHLFYVFDHRRVLHVHLGLAGRLRHHGPAAGPTRPDPPRRDTALRLETPELTVDLSTPRTCEVIDAVTQRRVIARLGPDPIAADDDRDLAGRLATYRGPVGTALLDQAVIAGIGNVYRAEILFLCGIHPERPAGSLSHSECDVLWATTSRLLRAGVDDGGRIITVDRREAAADRRPTYVYGRRRCVRCGSVIRRWDVGGRTAWACESCQPAWTGPAPTGSAELSP